MPPYIESGAVVILRFFKIPPPFGTTKRFFLKNTLSYGFVILFLAIIAAPAAAQRVNVCQHWIDNWRTHVGTLSGGTRIPTTNNSAQVWSVTAPTPFGTRTIHGQAWVHGASGDPLAHNPSGTHCWCRSVDPFVGPWVLLGLCVPLSQCVANCARHCGQCGLNGADHLCTRAALLAQTQEQCGIIATLDSCPADYALTDLLPPPAGACNDILPGACGDRGICEIDCVQD